MNIKVHFTLPTYLYIFEKFHSINLLKITDTFPKVSGHWYQNLDKMEIKLHNNHTYEILDYWRKSGKKINSKIKVASGNILKEVRVVVEVNCFP